MRRRTQQPRPKLCCTSWLLERFFSRKELSLPIDCGAIGCRTVFSCSVRQLRLFVHPSSSRLGT